LNCVVFFIYVKSIQEAIELADKYIDAKVVGKTSRADNPLK
jgi:hypothetical protein